MSAVATAGAEPMKLYSKEGQEVMAVTSVEAQQDKLVIRGQLMKSMPMTIHVKPEDLAEGSKLLSFSTVIGVIGLFLKGLWARRTPPQGA